MWLVTERLKAHGRLITKKQGEYRVREMWKKVALKESSSFTHCPFASLVVDLSSAADLRVESKNKPSKSKTSLNKPLEGNEGKDHQHMQLHVASQVEPKHPFLLSHDDLPEHEGRRSRVTNPQLPLSSVMGKNTFSKSMQPVHGRVDWTAKYGGTQ